MPTYAVSPALEMIGEESSSPGGKTHICLLSSTLALPVCRVKRPISWSAACGSEMTMAVSSLSLCGRDEERSELENAMPCFLGFRTRVISGIDATSSLPTAALMSLSADETWPGCSEVETSGSSWSASLSALLRKTFRRLEARKLGPSALSAMLMRNVQTVTIVLSVCQ